MKQNRHYLPILISGILVILTVGLGYITYDYQVSKAELIADFSKSLNAVSIAIEGVDLNKFSLTEDDLNLPEYQQLRKKLQGLWDIYLSSGVRGFYIMKLNGSEIRFVVDSAHTDDPWHSEPGVIYEEPSSEDLEIFRSGQEKFIGPYTDEYGSFYSYLSPIKNPDGSIAGILGADSEVETFENILKRKMYVQMFFVALVILGFITTLVLLARGGKSSA